MIVLAGARDTVEFLRAVRTRAALGPDHTMERIGGAVRQAVGPTARVAVIDASGERRFEARLPVA